MGLVRDRRAFGLGRCTWCDLNKPQSTVHDPWKQCQNPRLAPVTHQTQHSMAIRFVVMVGIWTTVYIFALPHQDVLVPSTAGGAPCSEDWVYYRNTCYHFSKEKKNWYQSQASCLSQNSSLLRIYNRTQQDFLRLIKNYYWLGLVKTPASGLWQWQDGSNLQPKQLTILEMQNGTCSVYGSSFKAYTEDCLSLNTYICMQETV
ncbi:NKG2-D type II integral membrane protein isoform 2-T2 [Thomomys bottae]